MCFLFDLPFAVGLEPSLLALSMRQTKKYSGACAILEYPHETQEELYSELNRLGWYWESKKNIWERNETLANPETEFIRVRVWAGSSKVEQAAQLFIESASEIGLTLIEKSKPYPCRPPSQNDSRIYLTFKEDE